MEFNPRKWELRHQVALSIAMAIGAAIDLVVGFHVTILGLYTDIPGGLGTSFADWMFGSGTGIFLSDANPLPWSFCWGAFGAAVGAGVIYIRRLS